MTSFEMLFKGIALFTPGGDLIYCIDPNKQGRWHLHLCVALQEILGLSEPPHFLVPGYTATVDRFREPSTNKIKTLAEVYQPVQRYQSLLNIVFGTGELVWQTAPWEESSCNPIILESYRQVFPQLWENHELIVRYSGVELGNHQVNSNYLSHYNLLNEDFKKTLDCEPQTSRGYVLRLFVSSNNPTTEKTLQSIHQLLEQGLGYPYTLKVIDISKHPEQAESNQVSATPTLVRVLPQPVRRIVGELDNIYRVLQILTTC